MLNVSLEFNDSTKNFCNNSKIKVLWFTYKKKNFNSIMSFTILFQNYFKIYFKIYEKRTS